MSNSVIIGVGRGLGYLEAKGDIIFTEKNSVQKRDIDVSGFGWAVIIVVNYQIKDFLFRIRGGGPGVMISDYDYEIFEFSFDIGYTFRL